MHCNNESRKKDEVDYVPCLFVTRRSRTMSLGRAEKVRSWFLKISLACSGDEMTSESRDPNFRYITGPYFSDRCAID